MTEVDVLIVGGGPAACATALSFLKSKPDGRFVIIDDSNADAFKIGESLPAQATQMLHYLSPDLPKSITQPSHLQCTGNASIWESPEVHEQFGMTNPLGYSWHLDRALFDQTIRDAVSITGEDRLVKGKFTEADRVNGRWHVKSTESGSGKERTYRANWLIDASGRKGAVVQKVGAKTIKSDDVLAFYVLYVTDSPTPDKDHRTLIEATALGWFYSAQLPRQRRLVAFHTSGSSSAAKLARRLPGFIDILNEHSTFIRQTIEENDYFVDDGGTNQWPKATAAGSSYLEPFANQEEKWCAVGDAAMAFDPLSSQGMITALKCGCMLGMSLAEETVDLRPLEMVYGDIRKDYDTKRKWYYGKAMFEGEAFWGKQ